MSAHPSSFQSRSRNGTVVAAISVLVFAALVEFILTGFALAPRLWTAIHNNNATALGVAAAANPSPTPNPSQLAEAVKPSLPPPTAPSLSKPSQDITQSVSSPDATAPTSGSDPSVQGRNSLEIVNVKLDGADGGSRKLVIAIKAPSDATIDVPQVKLQVYFYDTDGEEITPSKAQVKSGWLSLPVTWQKHGEPEVLEVDYLPDSIDSDIKFAGYVVAIYYKGDLQDYRAEPSRLTKLFPLKYFIGTDE